MEKTIKKETINPQEYFDRLKALKVENTDASLDAFYDSSIELLYKYKTLNQISAMKKLIFIIDCIPKERELIRKGIDIFLYKDDIEDYINDVEDKVVKIIELENYSREVPDEFINVINDSKDIFDKFYVLYTDYTGKDERKVEKQRRKKDPILFGAFKKDNELNDRFYYLGDWIDEYCDLTLSKLIKAKTDIVHIMTTPLDKEELIEECHRLVNGKSGDMKVNGAINNTVWASSDTQLSKPAEDYIKEARLEKKESKSLFEKIKTYLSKR